MNEVPIILLAAGQSNRMRGADKLMQLVDGIPLLRRSAQRAVAAGPVIVALPPAPHDRHTALDGLDVMRAEISDATDGMNASLRGAMALVPPEATAVMILLADLADLTSEDICAVVQAMKDNPDKLVWRGATEDGTPGHPVIFDNTLFSALGQLTGDTGAQDVVRSCKGKVYLHPLPAQNALLDLDTPEEWEAWRTNNTPKKTRPGR